MSAFVVNESHIDVLVQFSQRRQRYGNLSYYWEGKDKVGRFEINSNNASEIGQILLDENYRSVNYRYDDNDSAPVYKYMTPSRIYKPIEVIKACDCLNYQSCETDDWKETEAYAILQAIRESAIDALDPVGYEAAKWEITDPRRYPPAPVYTVNNAVISGVFAAGCNDNQVQIRSDSFWDTFNGCIKDAIRKNRDSITIEWILQPVK